MTEKSALFAFVAGEVSPAFYGRADLAKHPLALAEAENFFIDYKGGIFNRSGTKLVSHIAETGSVEFFRFRASADDYTLVFVANKMRVLRNGGYILETSTQVGTFSALGSAHLTGAWEVGNMMFLVGRGYATVTGVVDTEVSIADMFGQPISGTFTVSKVYELATAMADPSAYRFFQDLDKVVVTNSAGPAQEITYVTDTNWTIVELVENIPARPTALAGVPSAAGTASTIYAVTAVVNGIESNASVKAILTSIVNFTTTTGEVKLSWTGVTDAEYYNVYRSVVYPTGSNDNSDQLGYLGRTEGVTYVDPNRTPDFTKAPPRRINFFADGNYPALYTRFQQRGIYAGLKNDPLSVVGANNLERATFRANNPPIATDAFKYTIDAESIRPIKHMLPLRSGLLLFTADTISQLRGGGESKALTAVSAFAETQGYVSVSDLVPVAVNLDVLFMSGLSSEFNAMLYTEYTNSFDTRDIMALSSHMFSASLPAVQMDWAPEPHKMLYIVRADGQLVTLTYERNQEVFGWARQRTQGKFKRVCVVREENRNVPYFLVERRLGNQIVRLVERQAPREAGDYLQHWYVDCGLENTLVTGSVSAVLRKIDNISWELELADTLGWPSGDIGIYVLGGFFYVTAIERKLVSLRAVKAPVTDGYYDKDIFDVAVGEWHYGQYLTEVSGLWHLEGERVSVQVDGDGYTDLLVTDGTVEVPQPGVKFIVGLGYRARAKTLPLTLGNAIFEGKPVAVRRVSVRLLESKGVETGPSYGDLEMLPTRSDEAWAEPLQLQTDLALAELLGGLGWDNSAQLCLQQDHPMPAAILGLVYNLDIGDD